MNLPDFSIKGTPAPPPVGRIGAARQMYDIVKQARSWYLDKTRWTLSISSTDRLYDVAHRWFMDDSTTAEPPRALSARIRYGDGAGAGLDSADGSRPATVELYYDVAQERTVQIDGHPITVSVAKAGLSGGNASEVSYTQLMQPDKLYFHARSREGQRAVIAMLQRLSSEREKRRPALHLLNRWGGWSRRDDLPARTLDSVVLAPGQMERIQSDLERFLESEAECIRRGIPWHRGYLLHGPPGTGKTSLVRALSAHFGLDLWYAPLGDLDKDASLLNLIAEVGPRSVLLLEDVDVFRAAQERAGHDSGSGLSMAGLLNALDGVATPHGMVSFLTTNRRDAIDEALLRPGRVDLREEIQLPAPEQVIRLWNQFYSIPESFWTDATLVTFSGSSAELAELFKQHMDDAGAALEKITGGTNGRS